MESFGAYKQVDRRFASDARGQKILEDTTCHDGCRYQVGMLWTEDRSSLPKHYFSALVQLKSLERGLDKNPKLSNSYNQTITSDLDKSYIVEVDRRYCFEVDCPHEWHQLHHPVSHPHKPGKVRRVINGAAKFDGSSSNNALLTGPDLLQNLIHVLIRCHQYQNYAVSAVIESKFLQVGVIPQNQTSLPLMWREDPAE